MFSEIRFFEQARTRLRTFEIEHDGTVERQKLHLLRSWVKHLKCDRSVGYGFGTPDAKVPSKQAVRPDLRAQDRAQSETRSAGGR